MRGAAGRPGQSGISALANRDRDPGLCKSRGGAGRSSAITWDDRLSRGGLRHGPNCRGDASVGAMGGAEDHRARALPEPRERSARRRAAPRDLRDARPYRHPGRRAAHRFVEPGLVFPAAPVGAVDLVAVLAGREHRAQILSARRLRRDAAHRHSRAVRQLGRIPAACRHSGRRRADRGRHQIVVGFAAERPLSDARNAHHRLLHDDWRTRCRSQPCSAACCACCGA